MVELMIAMVLLAVGAVVLAQVVVATSVSQGNAKLRSQRSALAHEVFGRLESDQSWIRNETCALPALHFVFNSIANNWSETADGTLTPLGCDLTRLFADPATGIIPVSSNNAYPETDLIDDSSLQDVQFAVRAVATPVDLPADGVGVAGASADSDGLYDGYRLTVEAFVFNKENVELLKGSKRITATINSRQALTTGSLGVQLCQVSPQIDERLNIPGCSGPARTLPVVKPTALACDTYCVAAMSGPPQPPASNVAVTVNHIPAENSVTVTGPMSLPVESRAIVTRATDADGRVQFRDLKPGLYEVSLPPVAGYRLWQSHSIPGVKASGQAGSANTPVGLATVQVGATNNSVYVYEPDPYWPAPSGASFRLHFYSFDTTSPIAPGTWSSNAATKVSFKLLSAPYRRAQTSPTWTVVTAGTASMTVNNITPGLYSAAVGMAPNLSVLLPIYSYPTTVTAGVPVPTGLKRLWIDNTGTGTTDGVVIIKFCDQAARTALVATYCDGATACWYRFSTGRKYIRATCSSSPITGVSGAGGT